MLRTLKKPAAEQPVDEVEASEENTRVVKRKGGTNKVVAAEAVAEESAPVGKKARVIKKPSAQIAEVEETAEETAEAPKKARALKKPAAHVADVEIAEDTAPAPKKSRVLKKPASVEESVPAEVKNAKAPRKSKMTKKPAAASSGEADDEDVVNESASVLKKPAGILKKPSASDKGEKSAQDAETILANRKKELKSMDAAALKSLVLSKNLDASNKTANVEAVLAAEAQERQTAAQNLKDAKDVVVKLMADLAAKGNPELKDLCQSKGLKVGGSKDEKVERLFQNAKEAGDVDRAIVDMENKKRMGELAVMDKASLYGLCNKMGVDALNKEVMIDRIVAHERRK